MPAIMIDLSQAPPQREERYHVTDNPTDPVEAFRDVLASHGICPKHIDTSGKLVRVDVDKGDKAGWYVFFLDTISAGSFGNWRTELKETWCSIDRKEMSDSESARYQQIVIEAKRQREQLKAELQAAAKITANGIWAKSHDTIAHPYLLKKKVQAHGIKQSNGDLVVPLRDDKGEIHNLQFIKPDGSKKFLFGGRVDGLSVTIPGDNQLSICEGYATGATIHQATGATVICAFNRVNLLPVAKVVRASCPTASITICADNDRFTAGNPGLSDANKAAKAISARVVFPVFDGLPGGDDPAQKLTDFNDLATVGGVDMVIRQVSAMNTLQSGKLPPLTPDFSKVSGRVKARPKDREFIFRFNESGLIPRGVVGVLAAEGSTGKTLFLLSLAVAGARGGNFGPINASKPLNVLILLCEDDQDEMDRRLWDITKGNFPDRLYGASVYGEMGPIMRLEGSNPVIADAWFWLDETLSNHENLDLVVLDPKSRIYGLDENNNDHGTQWIQALEKLAKKHDVTILFSSHTSKNNAKDISQNMVRGGGAIVDGCRWQGGLIRMSEEMASKYGIDNPREYVLFDAPKSNYASDMPSSICFKRGNHGVLEYCEPGNEIRTEMADVLLEMLRNDTTIYSKNDLKDEPVGVAISREMKGKFPAFKRRFDMEVIINNLIRDGKLFEKESGNDRSGRPRIVLQVSLF